MRENGLSLQGRAKTPEGGQHPYREAQFCHLHDQVEQLASRWSAFDAEKQEELLGRLPHPEREWRPRRDPVRAEDRGCSTGPRAGTPVPHGRPRPDGRHRSGRHRRESRRFHVRGPAIRTARPPSAAPRRRPRGRGERSGRRGGG
ncbi:ISAzo13-like element transposase-related protein [Kitasatospora griseola]|uniref:ISAzo13-like element transposase-related protein n=1 Tax=Kitasatospora griseola TaxID=2064 RepID=UPI0034201F54